MVSISGSLGRGTETFFLGDTLGCRIALPPPARAEELNDGDGDKPVLGERGDLALSLCGDGVGGAIIIGIASHKPPSRLTRGCEQGLRIPLQLNQVLIFPIEPRTTFSLQYMHRDRLNTRFLRIHTSLPAA